MKRVISRIKAQMKIIALGVEYHWLTLAAGFLITGAAIFAGYIERGYFAVGAEILIFPAVVLFGYTVTPAKYVYLVDDGEEFRVELEKPTEV